MGNTLLVLVDSNVKIPNTIADINIGEYSAVKVPDTVAIFLLGNTVFVVSRQ